MPGWMRSGSSPMTARLAAYHRARRGRPRRRWRRAEMALGDRPQAVAATDRDGVERRGAGSGRRGEQPRAGRRRGAGDGRVGRKPGSQRGAAAALAGGGGRRAVARPGLGRRGVARAGRREVPGRTCGCRRRVGCRPIRSPGRSPGTVGTAGAPARAAGAAAARRTRLRHQLHALRTSRAGTCEWGRRRCPPPRPEAAPARRSRCRARRRALGAASSGVRWSARRAHHRPSAPGSAREQGEGRAESKPARQRQAHPREHDDEHLVGPMTRRRPGAAADRRRRVTACSTAIATSDRPRPTTDSRGRCDAVRCACMCHSMQFACVWSRMSIDRLWMARASAGARPHREEGWAHAVGAALRRPGGAARRRRGARAARRRSPTAPVANGPSSTCTPGCSPTSGRARLVGRRPGARRARRRRRARLGARRAGSGPAPAAAARRGAVGLRPAARRADPVGRGPALHAWASPSGRSAATVRRSRSATSTAGRSSAPSTSSGPTTSRSPSTRPTSHGGRPTSPRSRSCPSPRSPGCGACVRCRPTG